MELESITPTRVQDEIAFRRLIGSLGREFIRLNGDEVDSGVDQALQRIAEFLGIDHATVLALEGNPVDRWRISHEWGRPGTPPASNCLKEGPLRSIWTLEELERHNSIYIDRLSNLPEAAATEHTFLQSIGVHSTFMLGIRRGGALIGSVWFSSIHENALDRAHAEPLIALVANMFRNALDRRDELERMRTSEQRYNSLLSTPSFGMLVADTQGTIHEANRAVRKKLGFTRQQMEAGDVRWDERTPSNSSATKTSFANYALTAWPGPGSRRCLTRRATACRY